MPDIHPYNVLCLLVGSVYAAEMRGRPLVWVHSEVSSMHTESATINRYVSLQ